MFIVEARQQKRKRHGLATLSFHLKWNVPNITAEICVGACFGRSLWFGAMDFGIKDRLCLVTGASRGIGRGIAIALAREGGRVVLVARSADVLEAVRRELKAPDKHRAVALDLMEESSAEKLAEAVNNLGNLDILVHNLGGSARVFQPFAPTEDWIKVWQFNLGISHTLNRLFIPGMAERRWGRVVHLSTLSTATHQGYAAYVSAKCAVDGYVKVMSREVSKDGVIMSAVSPGAISLEGRYFAKLEQEDPAELQKYLDTHLPIRRFGTAEDVAAVVTFLCSEQASYMAGAIVAVNGGWK
jgi:3-oxoacyl-[acyl-carrier protein] reductase